MKEQRFWEITDLLVKDVGDVLLHWKEFCLSFCAHSHVTAMESTQLSVKSTLLALLP